MIDCTFPGLLTLKPMRHKRSRKAWIEQAAEAERWRHGENL